MTLNYGIFDVSDPQNPDRVYSAALLSRILSKHIRDGIVHGDGDEMAVTVTDPPAMTVRVGTGTAMVQGRFCENDAALTLAVPAAHATYPRIDRVVVRLNASPGRTIDIVVKPGTPAPEPAAPALTRTPEIWELSLAQVRVEAGATLILSEKITDERANTSLCGVAAPVYVPSSQLEVVGPVNMQGKALTGLPAPSGSTDAARKGYVDAEIAAKIAGFGISQIAIDADKDWNGKNITNVGSLQTTTGNIGSLSQYVDVPGSTLRLSDSVSVSATKGTWITVKEYPLPSSYSSVNKSNFTVSVSFSISDKRTDQSLGIRVLVGDTEIGAGSGEVYYASSVSCNTTGGIVQGQTLRIQVLWNPGQYAPNATCTVTGVQIRSTRSTTAPAYKWFPEGGMW